MRRTTLELATFAALAWYAAAHWAGLLVDPPRGRVFACVLIAVALAAALAFLARAPGPRAALVRAACVAGGLGVGVVAAGLDRRLLAPGHWDELADGLDRGFAAFGSVAWPYDGAEPWTRLVLLLAIPLVLTVAAACAFSRRRALRPVALVLLVALYGTAVTEHQFAGELGRGAALLVLVAAWLWLPRLTDRGWRTAVAAGAAVLAACVIALPAAARYSDSRAWVDYEAWNPFAAHAGTHFDWFHSYGPIDWSRDGTTLMNVRSGERHYWRVETLNRFDGFRWVRARSGTRGVFALPDPYRAEWETRFRVTIRDLDTDLFPVAGTALGISGDGPHPLPAADGTVETGGDALEEGDSYEVRAYIPDPSPAQMRAAPDRVPTEVLEQNTAISLPPAGTAATSGFGGAGDAARSAASEQEGRIASKAQLRRSQYARVLRLARRLARGKDTSYDVVRAIQAHLRSRYAYDEKPPARAFPLAAFLFRDRIGYCQQFSGAMALMLRMLDIPARVAAGFSPGSYNAETKEFRVRDLDAHSWVEVWFGGIGWVPFDPTPAIAPARLQSGVNDASASGGAGAAAERPDPPRPADAPAPSGGAPDLGGTDSSNGLGTAWLVLAGLALAALAAAAALRAGLRRPRGLPRSEDAALHDLVRALARLGQPVPPRATLRQLESTLERGAGAPAARYARMLRERRYAPRGGEPPDAAARRDLRLALTRGRGARAWLTGLVALPPGAFRRG